MSSRLSAARSAVARRLLAALRAVVDVRDDEVALLLWSVLDLFALLAGNYVIRPLRDEMGVAGGVRNLPWMFLGTLGTMLVVGAAYAGIVGRRGRPPLPLLYRILQVNLLAFLVAPRLLPAALSPAFARAFFAWASVYNLFVVSVVWGAMAGRFRADRARRLFGFLAAGGTLGAIAGSFLATSLAGRVGPLNLLAIAIAFLELGLFAARRASPSDDRGGAVAIVPPPGAARRSPYVAGLALNVLCFTITSACVYLEQAKIVGAAFANPAERTALFARIDLLVNLAGLGLQAFATGRIIAALGVGGAAALLPAVTLIGFAALWTRPSLGVLVAFQVARRAIDYAIARPCREIFYATARRDGMAGAKTLIDTAVYRAGDVLGAWAYSLFALVPTPFGTAALIVPLTASWAVLSLRLGQESRTQAAADLRKLGNDPTLDTTERGDSGGIADPSRSTNGRRDHRSSDCNNAPGTPEGQPPK